MSGNANAGANLLDVVLFASPIGFGIAVGLFAFPGWGAALFGAAALFSFAHIRGQSSHYQAYQSQLDQRGSKVTYFLQSTIWETVKMGLLALFLMTVVQLKQDET